jgi:hypothetical protein
MNSALITFAEPFRLVLFTFGLDFAAMIIPLIGGNWFARNPNDVKMHN